MDCVFLNIFLRDRFVCELEFCVLEDFNRKFLSLLYCYMYILIKFFLFNLLSLNREILSFLFCLNYYILNFLFFKLFGLKEKKSFGLVVIYSDINVKRFFKFLVVIGRNMLVLKNK